MKTELPLITIMGPTGVGKTDLTLALSEILPSQIISVDSVQIYKKMDIGSGKPSKSTLRKFPHKLVNIIEPWQTYSTALFSIDSKKEIENCYKVELIPLLVGGTMLYFKTLVEGISSMPKANLQIRKKITDEAKDVGWSFLHKRLAQVDPHSASRIHPNDSQRIQRALEVYELSSKPISEWQNESKVKTLSKKDVVQFAIEPESRELLRKKIKKRFLRMLDVGLVKEVETLLNTDKMNIDRVSMKSVGYRQVSEYLMGDTSYDEMINKAVNATRQLAKRQMTWLRNWKEVIWISSKIEPSLKVIKSRIKV